MSVKVKKLAKEGKLPTRAHADDAGLDLYSPGTVTVSARCSSAIATNVAIAVPEGHVGLVLGRSSLNRLGLLCLTGVIDAGYRGDVTVMLYNLTARDVYISRGDRIAQLVILPINAAPIEQVDSLDDTSRGSGGFGSTGA